MNSIMNSCDAYLTKKRQPECGDYIIDLSSSNTKPRFRPLTSIPLGHSCTYRVFSSCGYPTLHWEIIDPRLQYDYDFVYASTHGEDEMPFDQDITDVLNFNLTLNYTGAVSTGYFTNTVIADDAATPVPDQEWASCTSKKRNLWVTITRIQETLNVASE
jgi:hypothetical protein